MSEQGNDALNINLNSRAIEKLVDYAASGIGSTASFVFSRMVARRDAEATLISAEGDARARIALAESQAETLRIIAEAQADARSKLISPEAVVGGEVTFGDLVEQRIQFQEQKRQSNIESVVRQAALELGDKEVQDHQPDHDWTARFFSDVQDVSSEQMQSIWAKILAGEVAKPGSTSIRTLSVLKNLDQEVASLFAKFCCMCVFLRHDLKTYDARAPILGQYNEGNALRDFGIGYGHLNLLNEHGLVVSEYNSWRDYNCCITEWPGGQEKGKTVFTFEVQGKYWILRPTATRKAEREFRLKGVALTASGEELAMVVEAETNEAFAKKLQEFFGTHQLQMVEVVPGPLRSG